MLTMLRSSAASPWFKVMAATEMAGCLLGIVAYVVSRSFASIGYGMLVVALGVIPLTLALLKRESFALGRRK